MERMKEHSTIIVNQALLVSKELIRVAILWHEMWHEGLEEASRLYFNDKNPDGMIMVLEPLHKMLEKVCLLMQCLALGLISFRDRALLAKRRSLKCSAASFTKRERLADDIRSTETQLSLTRLGISTMGSLRRWKSNFHS